MGDDGNVLKLYHNNNNNETSVRQLPVPVLGRDVSVQKNPSMLAVCLQRKLGAVVSSVYSCCLKQHQDCSHWHADCAAPSHVHDAVYTAFRTFVFHGWFWSTLLFVVFYINMNIQIYFYFNMWFLFWLQISSSVWFVVSSSSECSGFTVHRSQRGGPVLNPEDDRVWEAGTSCAADSHSWE